MDHDPEAEREEFDYSYRTDGVPHEMSCRDSRSSYYS